MERRGLTGSGRGLLWRPGDQVLGGRGLVCWDWDRGNPAARSAPPLRLPPLRQENEPPWEKHAALRVLLPRVPLAVPQELGEQGAEGASAAGRARVEGPAELNKSPPPPLPPASPQVQRWTEQIQGGTFAGKI